MSVVVDSDKPPFAFVVIDGVAEVSRDQAELLHWATALGPRYMGADRAESSGGGTPRPRRCSCGSGPRHVIAIGGITD